MVRESDNVWIPKSETQKKHVHGYSMRWQGTNPKALLNMKQRFNGFRIGWTTKKRSVAERLTVNKRVHDRTPSR